MPDYDPNSTFDQLLAVFQSGLGGRDGKMPRVFEPDSTAGRLEGQFLQGFASMPAAPGFLYTLPGIAGRIAGFDGATELPGHDWVAEKTGRFMEMVYDLTESDPPETSGDVIANVIGGGIIPIPSASLPGAAIRGAGQLGGTVGKVAGTVGGAVADMAMPGFQGPLTKTGVAVNVGAPIALVEGLREYQGEDTIYDFPDKSFVGTVATVPDLFGGPAQAQTVPPADLSTVNLLEDAPTTSPDSTVPPQDLSTVNLLDGVLTAAPSAPPQDLSTVNLLTSVGNENAQEEVEDREWGKYILAGAGILIAGAVAKNVIARQAKNVSELSGTITPPKSSTPNSVKARQQLINRHAAAEYMGSEIDPIVRDVFASQFSTTTPQALHQKTTVALRDGVMPNSSVQFRVTPQTLERAHGALSPQQRATLSDGLLADSALDDIAHTGKQAAFPNHTPAQLRQMANAMRADPQLLRMANDIKEVYRDSLRYMEEAGFISTEQRVSMQLRRPNFAHMARSTARPSTHANTGQHTRTVVDANAPPTLQRRHTGEASGIPSGGAQDAVVAMQRYLVGMIEAVELNRVTRSVLETTESFPQVARRHGIKALPQRPNASAADNVISFRANGQMRHMRVEDPYIRASLRYDPVATVPLIGVVNNFAKMNFTGILAPFFAPTAAVYDAITSVLTNPNGYAAAGILNEGLSKLGVQRVLPIDPTLALAPITGTVRGLYGQGAGFISRTVAQQLYSGNGTVIRLLGREGAERLGRIADRAYTRSTRALMEQIGAINGHYIDSVDGLARLPRQHLAPNLRRITSAQEISRAAKHGELRNLFSAAFDYFRATPGLSHLGRTYLALLESIHSSVRLQFLANQVARNGGIDAFKNRLSYQEMAQAARATRELTGDPVRIGGSRSVQYAVDSMLYSNIALQVMDRMAVAWRHNPVRFLTGVAGIVTGGLAFLEMQFSRNPEARKHFLNEMNVDERSIGVPVYGDGSDIIGWASLPAELRPIWAPVVEVYAALHGFHGDTMPFTAPAGSREERAIDEVMFSGQQGFFAGMRAVVPDPLPVAARAGLELAGHEADSIVPSMRTGGLGVGFGRPRRTEGRTERLSGTPDALLPDGVFDAQMQNALNEVTGAVIRGAVQAVIDYHRATDATLPASDDFAFDIAKERFVGGIERASRSIPGLYSNRSSILRFDDTAFKLVKRKRDALRDLGLMANRDYRRDGLSTLSGRTGRALPDYSASPEVVGTKLGHVLQAVIGINKGIARLEVEESQLQRQREALMAGAVRMPNARTADANEVTRRIKELSRQKLDLIYLHEAALKRVLGSDFRFEDVAADPEAWLVPIQ